MSGHAYIFKRFALNIWVYNSVHKCIRIMLADSTLDCSSLFLKLIILLLLTVNNFLYAEETVEAENYCAILNFT